MSIFFGIIAGFLDSLKNVAAKKETKQFSESTINFAWMFFATVITLPLALFNIPNSIPIELIVVFVSVTILDFFAYILYLKSIKITDLSLSLPMLALTPVFVLVISWVFLSQEVKNNALIGVLLIIVGGYLLNITKTKQGLLDPFVNVVKNKGVFYMFITSLLWGIANSLHKIGITESNPLFYTGMSYLFLTILYLLKLLIEEKNKNFLIIFKPSSMKVLSLVGIFEGLTAIFQFLSQGLVTSSVLTIALKRTSIVFSSILGAIFFKENIKNRLIPIVLILIGVILISI
ncbi:MAG: DMT family transporter [Candidatus Dojkabacteria bacterium]